MLRRAAARDTDRPYPRLPAVAGRVLRRAGRDDRPPPDPDRDRQTNLLPHRRHPGTHAAALRQAPPSVSPSHPLQHRHPPTTRAITMSSAGDPTVDGRRQRGCGSYPASVDRTPVRPGTGVGSILVDRALTHTRSGIEGLPGSIGDRTTDKMTGEALMRYSFTNELATSASAWSLWRVWTDADRRAQRTPPQLRASSQVRADRTSRGRVLPMGYARRARSRDLSFAAVPPAAGATCSGCVQQS